MPVLPSYTLGCGRANGGMAIGGFLFTAEILIVCISQFPHDAFGLGVVIWKREEGLVGRRTDKQKRTDCFVFWDCKPRRSGKILVNNKYFWPFAILEGIGMNEWNPVRGIVTILLFVRKWIFFICLYSSEDVNRLVQCWLAKHGCTLMEQDASGRNDHNDLSVITVFNISWYFDNRKQNAAKHGCTVM